VQTSRQQSFVLVVGNGFGAKHLEAMLKARYGQVLVYRPSAADGAASELTREQLPEAFSAADGIVISPMVSDFSPQLYYDVIDLARASQAPRMALTTLSGSDPKSPIRLLQRFGVLEQRMLAGYDVAESRIAVLRSSPLLQALSLFAARTPSGLAFETPFCGKALPWVDFEDVVDAGAAALSVPRLCRPVFRIKGPACLSVGQVADRLAALLGQPIAHRSITVYEAQGVLERAGYPSSYTRVISEWWDAMVGGLLEVQANSDFELLTGKKPRSLEESAPALLQAAGFLPTTQPPCSAP
jgi:uncharacterized protein YbjT (DUF2867 family)